MICTLLRNLSFSLLLISDSYIYANDKWTISPEQIIKQELLINEAISSIYLLQINFDDSQARELLHKTVNLLDKSISRLPNTTNNKDAQKLLTFCKNLWPVISKHSKWLSKLPSNIRPPDARNLRLSLAKLDRQLLNLRQIILIEQPTYNQKLIFLEQALLMQKMTRQYLSQSKTSKKSTHKLETIAGNAHLKIMAEQFSNKMVTIEKEFISHPHAKNHVRQASMAWKYISSSITHFPKKTVPSMVILYNDRIVSQLSSIHNMF